jgi:hypothetical protein
VQLHQRCALLLGHVFGSYAIWSTVVGGDDPRTGHFAAIACGDTPRSVQMPNFSPWLCVHAASGAKPLPPAEEGHCVGSGIGRPCLSMRSADQPPSITIVS